MSLYVLLDMDGVLLDSERVMRACWEETAAAHGLGSVAALYRDCIGVTADETRRLYEARYGSAFPFADFDAACVSLFHDRTREGVPVKPGAAGLLRALRQAGARVALASSTRSAMIRQELTQVGLYDLLDEVVGGEMAARSKPAPDIYLEAAARLGADPRSCWAVEDSCNGIRAASAAGCRTIMVPDLLEPTEEMRRLCAAVLPDLDAVRLFLLRRAQNTIREEKNP